MSSNTDCSASDSRSNAEAALWGALDLDGLGEEMASQSHAPNKNVMMGTGRTQNACQLCSNSATTSGCGGC